MNRLRIAIDSALRAEYSREILWSWRNLLMGIRYPWQEVILGHRPCDIVFGPAAGVAPGIAKLIISAEREKWQNPAGWRLYSFQEIDGWRIPRFQGEPLAFKMGRHSDGSLFCRRDLIFDIFWLLTGQEEAYWPKNRHGHMDLGGSGHAAFQATRLALASGLMARLQQILEGLVGYPAVPRWPGG